MLCYRDKEFCASDCQVSKCPYNKQLTYSICRGAEKAGLPLNQRDCSADCSDYIPKDKK